MPSFEIQADIFTRLSLFDSPKGSPNTFTSHKNISLYFKRRYLIIYMYLEGFLSRILKLFKGNFHQGIKLHVIYFRLTDINITNVIIIFSIHFPSVDTCKSLFDEALWYF